MAPDVGAVITTPERRDPTASAVARPVNKAPARRAVIATPRSGGPFARVPPASNSMSSARIEAARPRPAGARFTRAGPRERTRPQFYVLFPAPCLRQRRLGTRETTRLMTMARYFFDFRSDEALSADDEGLELLDADAAHQQAVGALVEGIRDIVLEGAKDQRFAVEVRDDLGRVLQISAVLESEFFRKQ